MQLPTNQAFKYAAPAGIPGAVTRVQESCVEAAMLIAVSSVFAQAFGIPLVYATGGVSQYSVGKVAADFAGVLVREAPGITATNTSGLDDAVPNSDQPNGMCTRGYVNVKCVVGTPARGGVVYIQVVASGGVAVGDFRADGTDSGNAVALTLTQASWAADGKDAVNNASLRVAR